MGGFNLQDLMSKAKSQYESLQKKMQETVVEACLLYTSPSPRD